MSPILDHFENRNREFRPETPQEFFALQLARKLDDAASVRSYVDLVDRHSEDTLIAVYRCALQQSIGGDLLQRFRQELRRWTREEGLDHVSSLAD